MSETKIKCMDCKNEIIPIKKLEMGFIPKLNDEERIAEINKLIEKKIFENIHLGICVNCLHEYIVLMKQKTNEEKTTHNNYMISLKDLILDISDQDSFEKAYNEGVNEKEIKELEYKYMILKNERIELENRINENKKDLKNLRKEEENICININKNIREKEENKEVADKLKKKLEYLKREYDDLINKSDDDDDDFMKK